MLTFGAVPIPQCPPPSPFWVIPAPPGPADGKQEELDPTAPQTRPCPRPPAIPFTTFLLAQLIPIAAGAGLPEEKTSLGQIPADLVNSSPADARLFI